MTCTFPSDFVTALHQIVIESLLTVLIDFAFNPRWFPPSLKPANHSTVNNSQKDQPVKNGERRLRLANTLQFAYRVKKTNFT